MLVHDCCAAVYLTDPGLFARSTGAVRVVVGGIASGQTIQRPDNMSFAPGDWDGRRSQLACYDGEPDEIMLRIRMACGAEG